MSGSGPVVVCVRGPSRSGKSTLCQALVGLLRGRASVAWAKRTHHALDLPHKSTGRVWDESPAAMVVYAPDRLQLTLPPVSPEPRALVGALPDSIDLVLLETHEYEPYPAIVSVALEPAEGEQVLGRFSLETIPAEAARLAEAVFALLPKDLELARAMRVASRAHGGHDCAGIVLGTRLALLGASELGLAIPDREKRLIVTIETGRCAADAIQALTGCTLGRRTLRLADYGRLAATFYDQQTGRAIRVAARGGVRNRVITCDGERREDAQRRTYLELPAAEIFTIAEAAFELGAFDRPGPPLCRVLCAACGEEVSDARHVRLNERDYCRPCAAGLGESTEIEKGVTP